MKGFGWEEKEGSCSQQEPPFGLRGSERIFRQLKHCYLARGSGDQKPVTRLRPRDCNERRRVPQKMRQMGVRRRCSVVNNLAHQPLEVPAAQRGSSLGKVEHCAIVNTEPRATIRAPFNTHHWVRGMSLMLQLLLLLHSCICIVVPTKGFYMRQLMTV